MPSEASWSESEALLADDIDLPDGAQRDASVVLAGIALKKHGGDAIAAAESLTQVLQAIGVTPYETERPRTLWGYIGKPSQNGAAQ